MNDGDYFIRAAQLIYDWATSNGTWVEQGAAYGVDAGCNDDALDSITFEHGEAAARLVEECWNEVRGSVIDRIELEIAESA